MTETGRGQTSAAIAYLEEARALAGDLDIQRRGGFLASIAKAFQANGDVEGAIRAGTQALALLRQAESDIEVGRVENELALTYLAAGSSERALELAAEARRAATARRDERLLAEVIDTQAMIRLETGHPEQALALAEESLDVGRKVDSRAAIVDASITRARSLAALGRHDEAASAFEEAAAASEHAPASRRRAIMTSWAESLAALGRHDEAFALARQALALR